MAVLITGGAGFIGSHIVDKLISQDEEVVVVDNLFTGNITNVNSNAKFYQLDITNPDLETVFAQNKIDYVIHQAAQTSVAASVNDPIFDMKQNIAGSLNLFMISKKYQVKKIIAASTAAVYGVPQYLPITEDHPISPLSFYGLSKFTMENYLKLLGVNYIILRYSNVFGPRQDLKGEAGVVALFINQLLEKKNIAIHGDGEQTRDFIYVDDVAMANILALKSSSKNLTINISTNHQVTVNQLFNILNLFTHSAIKPKYTAPRIGDIPNSILDNSQALKILKWSAAKDFETGLKETIEWYSTKEKNNV